ncbi:DNA alkylation repair protein [Paenibacillus sp. GCM10012307]|uniref:DNA alkylation repair protein n=1 Tax=Paenibacillus roseus TaxID=2798579 RepID=A0A934MPQ3_9BACL|nr:DNA alkylation repair protein [Paenibacillus roseus]MBJ6360639.1 DNA alkylation repair protein [Paenibacillus roseus]
MAQPLKEMYTPAFLQGFGLQVQEAYPVFDPERFVASVMDETWKELELKERIRKISTVLGACLPPRYEDALDILYTLESSCIGFAYLFFPDFVEVHGQAEEHWELSMQALERFTVRSSAEFAVRCFLLRDPVRMMKQMTAWAEHPNEHVRRLASEGSRPRLPWGQALPMFKRDPAPVLKLLELLKADPSLYVRKSVANNLNDIAKDHPELVLKTAARWQGDHPHTNWIIRHGSRTLIRKALPEALKLFGYADATQGGPLAISASLSVVPHTVKIGDAIALLYELKVRDGEAVRIRVEYGIDFIKANGKTSRKLFLLSDKTVPGGHKLEGARRHSFANLTTRKHYPGEHRIVLLINGVETAQTTMMLE